VEHIAREDTSSPRSWRRPTARRQHSQPAVEADTGAARQTRLGGKEAAMAAAIPAGEGAGARSPIWHLRRLFQRDQLTSVVAWRDVDATLTAYGLRPSRRARPNFDAQAPTLARSSLCSGSSSRSVSFRPACCATNIVCEPGAGSSSAPLSSW
jgi:hypothetical protein